MLGTDTLEIACARLPAVLRAPAAHALADYRTTLAEVGLPAPSEPYWGALLARLFAMSPFVAETCARRPEHLATLLAAGALHTARAPDEYPALVAGATQAAADESALGMALRGLRRQEMLRIAFRDLAGWAALDETLAELSAFADACVAVVVARLHDWQCAEWGAPRARGRAQSPVVLALGKLGGAELNFSSDIDLILAYPEDGRCARSGRDNGEYFARLAQRLVQVLSAPDEHGFVFRVDLRLRPFGEAGPLAMGFDAIEEYYQTHGRDWERYALIKARAIAGDLAAGERLLARLAPFVYRRYLDFGAVESLRALKTLIAREVDRKGYADHIKLGPGGIREIEFIAQLFQLIRGGREPRLRGRGLRATLSTLAELGHMPVADAEALGAAYGFLRRVENRLQAMHDTQTHELPHDALARARLALAMGCTDWAALMQALDAHRAQVQTRFERIFARPPAAAETLPDELTALWQGGLERRAAGRVLRARGFRDAEVALERIAALREGARVRALSTEARARLDVLMPTLLAVCAHVPEPHTALERSLELIEAIAGRSSYLALLASHPPVLERLVALCAQSPWIARLLARQPLLLDELLDARRLHAPLTRSALAHELDELLARLPEDLEQQMEALRHFKEAQVLRIAVADLGGDHPVETVGEQLSDLAEALLGAVLRLAREYLVARHGVPGYRSGGRRQVARFAILGYGKLGAGELGYGSDLDLVFLHDSHGDDERTAGPRQIENGVFFARLAQRIIHLLNAVTPAGVLYEVDTRLRPSGASGLLVTSIQALAHYQRSDAWTWEHQALTRARAVAGDAALGQSFMRLRAEVLARPREPRRLAREVRTMRARMRGELDHGTRGAFDLKQGVGGIADGEFMLQYALLRDSARHPELADVSGTRAQLAALVAAGTVAAQDAGTLAAALAALRARLNHRVLQEQPTTVPARELREARARIRALWRHWFEQRISPMREHP